LQINEYRKQIEEEKAKRLRDMELATKQANLQQMEEKINKEAYDRQLATHEKIGHIEYITGNDFFTENTVFPFRLRKLVSQC
jgi:hypothetical protein